MRRHAGRAGTWLWYLLALVLVLMALTAGVASQLLLPLAERHPERVAQWLSERSGRPVRFDTLETEWTRRGPLLRVGGLRIGEGAQPVSVGAAEILVSQYAGLLPGRSLTELRLRNVHLHLQRRDDGSWHVRGLPGEQADGEDPFAGLERLGEVQVLGGRLDIDAPGIGLQTHVPRIDVRLRVDGDRVRAAARAWRVESGAPMRMALTLSRASGDGRAWAGIERADLDGWSPLLRHAGVAVVDGHGDAGAWVSLQARRIVGVRARADLEDVAVQALAAEPAADEARFERLDADLEWRLADGGWRLDARRLRLRTGGAAQSLDGAVFAGGARQAFVAQRVDAGPLLALLPLSDRLGEGLRAWLRAARPGAVLHDVEYVRHADGDLRLQARVEGLSFAPVGERPGLSAVAGRLSGDAGGIVFEPDAAARWRLDWPGGFSAPHLFGVRGRIVAWRGDDGWEVATPALRIDGDGYGADVRGGLRFQGDGSRPWIDLAAEVDEADVTTASRFWLHHEMSEAAIGWLDDALRAGRVRNGRAVVSGDLDDWPFRAEPGRLAPGTFLAEAELSGLTLRFRPDWPPLERLGGRVRFVADGFHVRGSGAVAGVELPRLEGGIAAFRDAELRVGADATADVAAMFAMLRQTPLYEGLDVLDGLRAEGPARGRFAMMLGLRGGGLPAIDGEVALDGVRVSEPAWTLRLDQVRGALRYDARGLSAADLAVRVEDRPGRLSLAAGPGHVRDPAHVFEGELRTELPVAALIDRVDALDWLRPHASGRSAWSVGVEVPQAQAGRDAPPVLRLRSDLRGTALALPVPLEKPAAEALAAEVRMDLPIETAGHEVAVRLGDRLALRARTGAAATGLGIALGGAAAPAPPASGLVLTGRTGALAATDWVGLLAAGGDGGGVPLRRIDLQVDRLALLGGSFADVRIRAAPVAGGTSLGFEGAALAGSVQLPDGAGPVVARFERMHWQRPAGAMPAPAAATAQAPAPPADDALDPARLPELRVDVADLRVGTVQLGQARLRTRPAADGLRIEQLQASGPDQRIDVTGDWSGRGAAQRTRIDANVRSEDYGALLAGLGQGVRLRGGDGEIRLEAAWPGSPAGFRVDALDGRLSLLVKEGQLVDVEPGAGRVLGLLSVAELPRRLTLDFRDFFDKGFAFNRIGGEVRFGGGLARAEHLVIDGPAAEIRIAGSADLRAQAYDQTIDVHPKSGNLLTAVGAIAGGPLGAAVGAAANAVLRRPLGELGASTYRVTGPWADPKVEVIRAEQSRGTAPPPQPPQL
ncbi:TIGR02099 family protein [Luteimonas sp. Y-2-2-4F]|nr:YhdP family protein [Luteimonas sp. Y-2-2-4F]MCD9031496.1 TIGR02099 family protein [Luteimonas sp. Y-2-2-4F]